MTYVTQLANSQRDGCNDSRLHEVRLARQQSVQPTGSASTAPEYPHLWLTGKDARVPARLLPAACSMLGRGRLVAKEPPARGPRKTSPFARRTRRDVANLTKKEQNLEDATSVSKETIRDLPHRLTTPEFPHPQF
ncbi:MULTISPECIES: hypothetical protein [Paraburkholderia]|uniref:Uncharacterized protein n=1 Tax=Paraburkholderia podalyriae TaxID=1938811 RepID=A0ABR7PQ54_9BURK|nr:hypothetical protein [Paraburkholderia podalyriae]MBC8748396.1 hypothetical protein [Paraburkholderia podalyriae]